MGEKKTSFYNKAWRKFKKNILALVGLTITFSLILIALLAPWIAPYDPDEQFVSEKAWSKPSLKNIFGTDYLGRDILSRIIYGTRVSLVVGVLAVLLQTMIGVPLGAISGYFGGVVDSMIMRFTDLLLTLPSMFLLILAMAVLKQKGIYTIVTVIGLLWWTSLARIVRAEFLSLKERPFVEAARSIGASDLRIIFRHILPNSLPPIITLSTYSMASAILSEAGISFLGLADPTIISWGKMLSSGMEALRIQSWGAIIPGILIFISVFGFNILGDGLRDAFDIR